MKVIPLEKQDLPKKEEISGLIKSEKYPKYWVNIDLFTVRKEYAPGMFESIQYYNRSNNLNKWFALQYFIVKPGASINLTDFIEGFRPCSEKEYFGIIEKAINWLSEHISNLNYTISKKVES